MNHYTAPLAYKAMRKKQFLEDAMRARVQCLPSVDDGQVIIEVEPLTAFAPRSAGSLATSSEHRELDVSEIPTLRLDGQRPLLTSVPIEDMHTQLVAVFHPPH